MKEPLEKELEIAKRLAREAGALILEVAERGYEVRDKPEEGGPVTEADLRANEWIERGLRQAFPGDGVVTEESAPWREESAERCWYVDPLDGTKEFIRGNGEYAVHIGLAIGGEAKLGVIYRPVGDRLHAGVVGGECWLEEKGSARKLHMPKAEPGALTLAVSRSHRSERLQEVREALGAREVIRSGSVGLKCALVAEGRAHLYAHASPRSYRWDACAPEAVVRAAGGVFVDLAGKPYRYGEGEIQNARGILVCREDLLPHVLPTVRVWGERVGLFS